ncbi:TolC family protein [Aquabacterium humicola]|uniref:TolC family protein n=1 Tax=Aquabacterium humicola TaxID=3237377 RepID=UPI00254292E2|nr:TolC family protein [Rubrivivax pictus]
MNRKPARGSRARSASGMVQALLCMMLSATPLLSAAQSPPLGADLPGLLEQARRANPEFGAMRLEADAAAQRIQPAGALPDPVLRVELENVNNYGNDARASLLPSKVGETKYTLMQSLPLWGKRALREQLAGADAEQARTRAAATWNELAMRVKAAYAQLYLAVERERLAKDVLDLMTRLERIAQARYAGGLVPQQDAIRAQVEQTAMRTELIALDNEKRQQRARLNALLAREMSAPLADPQALLPLPPAPALSAEALLQRARRANPALQGEAHRVESAQANRELTWRNRYPDISVGLSPTQMGSRITTWSVMVEMSIPLQQAARRAQEREAVAMVDAAQARAAAAAHQLAGELAGQLAGLEAARRTEALARTELLPQSELGFRSALAAYENGKADFATLLEAQRQIRRVRQDLLMAQAEARMRLAEIERTVGEDL